MLLIIVVINHFDPYARQTGNMLYNSYLCTINVSSTFFFSGTLVLFNTSLADITNLNLNGLTSLTHISLYNPCMAPTLCEKFCQQLRSLTHLEVLELSHQPLCAEGHHLAESMSAWGTDPPVRTVRLWDCAIAAEHWPLLMGTLSSCSHLVSVRLSDDRLIGCLPHFIRDTHPGLEKLRELHVNNVALSEEDLQHLTKLWRRNKMPRLSSLWLKVMCCSNGIFK